ncbi:hypothetical protein Pan216_03490 [Planctomycetes bacterium Pan216]|uniref:DUF4139 domain-containing protein n=1 Tax=Kolteria novifilia TaxID=2527975 RepID=A0A518AXV7_9BACT|nr:hypothetical protein Pan216_03490 [Planctomycetes bacterium Pan216]
MATNRVVIYSNGIADFQRCYTVRAASPERISIPVRQDHLADVLASFNVFGEVSLDAPPTFRPTNEREGNLSINANRVVEDLATSLSGARVRIERVSGSVEGTLVGLHEEEEATAGEPVKVKSVIVLTACGLQRCPLREIQTLRFLDEEVQAEIDKSLQRNFQRIKPNSTYVEMTVSTTEEETDAVVQYTLPAAAWKISYRLRLSEDPSSELQGFAVVDNITEEDWTDFTACVVTGDPITFSTDLADSKTPARKHVDLVSEMALGSVDVEAPVMMAAPMEESDEELDRERGSVEYSAMPLGASFKSRTGRSAKVAEAEVQEVGDFCLFESPGAVTIPAKRSAVIPVFTTAIAEAKRVLHYKHEHHGTRPYRSVEFTNESAFSLGRGVCTVYEEGAYSGNCVVPPMKPGEVRLLAHALETGVAVQTERQRLRDKDVSISLVDGACYTSTVHLCSTDYHVRSSREERYELFLDHDFRLSEPEVEAVLLQDGEEGLIAIRDRLSEGVRYSISLPAKAELRLRVSEKRLVKSEVRLVDVSGQSEYAKIGWLIDNIVKTNGPLADDPGVQRCVAKFQEREAIREKIRDLVNQTEQLATRQERLRKNIKSGGQDELTTRWRQELDEAERMIQEIDEVTIPKLREQEKEIEGRFREAIKSLSAEWSAESK